LIKLFWLKLVFLPLVLGLLSLGALAHPLDLALLNLSSSGKEIDLRLEMNPGIAANLLGVDLESLPGILNERAKTLYEVTLGEATLSLAHLPCLWSNANPLQVTIENSQLLVIHAKATCVRDAGELNLSLPYLKKMIPTYRLMYMAKINGNENVGDADFAHSSIEFAMTRSEPTFSRFVSMGIEHIGVSPEQWWNGRSFHLPYGMDHILFVFALMLCCTSWLTLLKTVSGFTLGHTFSLAVATFGVIQVSGRLIEALIALTIAFVAGESFFNKDYKNNWKITIGIGMIHGLGFAVALSDLHLETWGLIRAIIGFNLGVELGQAVIVALFFYGLRRLKLRRGKSAWILNVFSAAVFLIASRWFLMRVFI